MSNRTPPKKRRRRICVVTASRTDYSRLKPVLEELYKIKSVEISLIVVGSHLLEKYGTTIKDIERDGFPITEKSYDLVEGGNPITMAKSVGLGVMEFATVFNNYNPDIVVVHGDRFDNFSAGLAAALMNIPVAHIQGGEVSGTIDESLRHAMTKLAHIHFPSNQRSRQRLIKLGEDPKRIFNFGCPATDLLLRGHYHTKEFLFSKTELVAKDGRVLDPRKKTVLAVLHPVTSEYNRAYWQMTEFLKALDALKQQTIMLFPNPDAGSELMITAIRRFLLKHPLQHVQIYKNFYHSTFVSLLKHSDLVIGNSSIGVRETCYFGIPTVNVGTRELKRDRGHNVVDCGYRWTEIYQAAKKQLAHSRYLVEYVYGKGDAGKKIARKLATIKIGTTQKTIAY